MKEVKNSELAMNWIEAFNQKDMEALLSLYHEDAGHYSPKLKLRQPETGGLISGKSALRQWWQEAFSRLPGLHYHLQNLICSEKAVFLEYIRQVPGEADLLVGEVLEITDGLIQHSRVYHG